MSEPEISLEENDRRRREAIAAAEEAVLAVVEDAHPGSPADLRIALGAADLDVEPALVRTAVLRLLNEGRISFAPRTAGAAP